jgi:hypothetical protein
MDGIRAWGEIWSCDRRLRRAIFLSSKVGHVKIDGFPEGEEEGHFADAVVAVAVAIVVAAAAVSLLRQR